MEPVGHSGALVGKEGRGPGKDSVSDDPLGYIGTDMSAFGRSALISFCPTAL